MTGDDDADDDDQEGQPAEPQLFDAGEPRQVRKRETKRQIAERRADEWWQRVLSDPVGRAQMWGILQTECHAFEERFACGPSGFPQPEATWFEAGKQSVGLRLYQTLMARDPVNTQQMVIENDPRFAKWANKEDKNG